MKTSNSPILSSSPLGTLFPSRAYVNAACRKDLVSFVRKIFHVLAPSATFHMNWHICAIAYYLEQVWLGKIKRLIITVPPRSLKSIMCSVAFPAFVLASFCREMQVSTEKRGFVRFFLLRFLVDMYVCLMAHV